MKRYVKLLLILPLILSVLWFNDVKAEDEGLKTVSLKKSGIQINYGPHKGSFYMASLGEHITLCMNPGKKLRNGAQYKFQRSIPESGSNLNDTSCVVESSKLMNSKLIIAATVSGFTARKISNLK